MSKIIMVFMILVFFSACSSKKEKVLMQVHQQKTQYYKNLQKTEKVRLYDANNTKVTLTATHIYVPMLSKNDKRNEVFIIGIYFEDQEMDETTISIYTLKLNGKLALSTKTLQKNDKRLKDISFVTAWANYYLVTFPHTKSKKLNLVFKSKKYGKGTLYFAKVGKYVLSKESL